MANQRGEIPKTWLEKMLRYFHVYDKQHGGEVTRKSYVDEFTARAQESMSEDQVSKISALRDTLWTRLMGGDGLADSAVSKDQFIANMGSIMKAAKTVRTLRQTFDLFFEAVDANNDGMIEPEEFAAILKLYGLTEEDATIGFTALDIDGDGLVSKEEFINGFVSFFTTDEAGSAHQLFGH